MKKWGIVIFILMVLPFTTDAGPPDSSGFSNYLEVGMYRAGFLDREGFHGIGMGIDYSKFVTLNTSFILSFGLLSSSYPLEDNSMVTVYRDIKSVSAGSGYSISTSNGKKSLNFYGQASYRWGYGVFLQGFYPGGFDARFEHYLYNSMGLTTGIKGSWFFSKYIYLAGDCNFSYFIDNSMVDNPFVGLIYDRECLRLAIKLGFRF